MKGSKIYILTIHQGSHDDYHWWIDSIYSDAFKAEKRKREIEKKIELIKMDYENEFGRSYDEDAENKMLIDKEDRWEKFYTYQFKHEELEYTNIVINEHEVL